MNRETGQVGVSAGWSLARAVAPIFHRMLDRVDAGLEAGAIEATLPDGTRRLLGGRREGPLAIVHVVRWRALWRLASAGSVGWYEGWAAGDWSSPDPVPLFDLFMRNAGSLRRVARAGGPAKLVTRAWHRLRRNSRNGARRNIAFHYDLGNDFYREWLDASLTYSAAIYAEPIDPTEPLEYAQDRKLSAVLARTRAQAGDTILEIGCGWGSFAQTAAAAGIKIHCITLSQEQRSAVEALGSPGVSVAITDYRDVRGQFDAVASIEMVEAVGKEYWQDYLGVIARSLKPGGRAAIQYIAIDDAIFEDYADGVDFIQRYVFPGGLLLSESRFRVIAEEQGLEWTDHHGFGLHYAETLRIWRDRFEAAVAQGRLPARFDARFVDLWRYYLMYCEGGFRGGGIEVAQITLVKR